MKLNCLLMYFVHNYRICPECGGSGYDWDGGQCPRCAGMGEID